MKMEEDLNIFRAHEKLILTALNRTKSNKKAAELLGIDVRNLYNKKKQHHIKKIYGSFVVQKPLVGMYLKDK